MKAPWIIMIFGLCIYLMSCADEMTTTSDEEDLTADASFFTPNPILVSEQEVVPLAIGAKAPDFKLPGVDGRFHMLSEYDEADVFAIIFTCNHCPTAQAYEERIKEIVDDYQDQSFELIAISPNSPLGLLYEELGYSDLNDDFEDMIIRAEDADYNFDYLYDGDDQKVSLQYGPAATPHAFVFDKNRALRYRGRIDASEKPGSAQAEDLREAIDALLAGQNPETSETKSFGCSTKWGWKTEYKTKVDQEWKEKPVDLTSATLAEIGAVMKNEDSEKLRLINVWATWCGPCIIEYPDFVVLQRMYGARDFEFVSISADKHEQKEKALAFLEKQASAVTNYILTDDDKYAMIEAIDPDWNGALPYTALIEPGGNKVWSHQGSVDFHELKRAIVDHPMIGRYY